MTTHKQSLLIRMSEVTAIVGFSRRTVERWVIDGKFPAPMKIGGPHSRTIAWRREDVEEWVDGLES